MRCKRGFRPEQALFAAEVAPAAVFRCKKSEIKRV
jgi:hypothetical protein